MAIKREFTFASKDEMNQVHGVEWMPQDGRITAVVQLVHGMTEHIERYEGFAEFLTEHGLAVVGHDHLGHGKTAASPEDYGYFHRTDGNGMLIADIHQLKELTRKKYPGVPYFILGHSMGSFLLRQYLYLHGEGIDGAIVMGTGTQPMAVLKLGQAVCKLLARKYGWRHRSNLIRQMAFGSNLKRIKPARTKRDWLTRDEKIVDKYGKDPLCTFNFTLNGYYNLFYSIEQASLKENLERMPKELPVFFVAGGQDPVGGYGKGVDQVRRAFEDVGMKDLTWIIYEEDRHEILNELDKEKVYQDIYAWLYVRIQGVIG